MKQSWNVRCIFIILCASVVLYLGVKRNILFIDFKEEFKEYPLYLNEVMVNNRNSIRDGEGDYEDWIEIYNKGDTAINLKGFGLSNDVKQPFLWTFSDAIIAPKSFCIVWASGKNINVPDLPMHTNFKLKNKDKVIILTAPNNWKDIFILEQMGENISYGRKPDGSSKQYGFDGGTPGETNISEILIGGPNTKRLEGPIFSHNGGFYPQSFNLILKSNDSNSKIYYTLDGSAPTKESEQYTKSIPIPMKNNGATVVRAIIYKNGYPKSEIITHSYFVEEGIYNNYNTPIISLVTDPENLFDYERGIYVAGKVFDQWKMDNPNNEPKKYTPANYNQRGKNWEREGSIELFEMNGEVGLIQNIGIRISGDNSRANNIKSLSLWARDDYDDRKYFIYDFFDGKAKVLRSSKRINKFSRILLRTSGTDSGKSLFRDALMQSLIQTLGILDTQSSRACIVYINGEYYGIHNIREAYDKDYINNYYDVDEEDVVMIKNPTGIAGVDIHEGYAGDEMLYNKMIDYVQAHDLKSEDVYNFIKSYMDTDNYLEYSVLQIYCDNTDWPGGNVGIWRKRTKEYEPGAPYGHDGRWRWMVFDMDHGFGLFEGDKAAENNSLKRATDQNGPSWPNPPWATLLLRTLLQNNEFRNQFINVFADRLNTIFSSEFVLSKIEEMEEIYYPNIKNHITRWNLHNHDVQNWRDEITVMKNFATERPKYMRQHIVDYFGLSGVAAIRIEMNEGGLVKINSLEIELADTPWEGIYFKDIPITVEAIPKSGYAFAGWEGVNKSQDRVITINLSHASYLRAVFKSDKNNEINIE